MFAVEVDESARASHRLTPGGETSGINNYTTRLMNSALQERYLSPRWRYDSPTVTAGEMILEVTFAQSPECRTSWPNDYWYKSVHLHDDSVEPRIAVHTELAKLAGKHDIPLNDLHRYLRFSPARAAVRTLLIELENPEAHDSMPPDEAAIIDRAMEAMYDTKAQGRQTFLTNITMPGPDFADRALIFCLAKLYTLLKSWDCWRFGSREPRCALEVLLAIIGLFGDAWAHAPAIDVSWSRLEVPAVCPFSARKTSADVGPPSSEILTPEVWFEWSLLFDPWIRRTDTTQLVTPVDNLTISPKKRKTSAMAALVLVTQVSEPEPEREGRVVIKYNRKPDEERWMFKSILDSRWAGKKPRTGLQYLVDWGYAEPTWQPARDLQGCDQWVLGFHRLHHGKPGPVPRLKRLM
ncbi:hypothetical protein CCHL11_08865 [Colletotrichum chlorophyti]|uniref:Chromo domain-containing protein n=1 Tax=Colletotrichum chlorophyti TaxID=708187 RepID=A0A1Q8S0G6_9PEZI|nr:hypothetical protein CCHL11_08865 [Colletotrichum chlorophyti]